MKILKWLRDRSGIILGILFAGITLLAVRQRRAPKPEPEPYREYVDRELDRNEVNLGDTTIVNQKEALEEKISEAAVVAPKPKTLEEALKRWNEDR